MRISKIHIKNYRCIKDEAVCLDDLTTLVGPNGSGKSSVLRALSTFYETRRVLTIDDFYNRDTSQPVEIAVTYTDLTELERTLFSPYVDGDQLTVTKVATADAERYHGARPQHSGFDDIRTITNGTQRRTAYNQLGKKADYADLPAVTKVDEAEGAMQAWEASHPNECEMKTDNGQFFGFRQVGQAKLERYTRFVFVPAVRDAEAEAADTRGSAIFELMQFVVRSVLSQSKALADFKEQTQSQYADLIKPENVPQLAQLGARLTGVLVGYVPNASVHVDWDVAGELSIPDPKAGVQLEEDGFRAPVVRVGHGLQRAFILSLLQSLAAVQAEQAPADEGEGRDTTEGNAESSEPERIPDLILAIEEPELYQHPNRQRHFADVLLRLAAGHIPGVAERTQVVYCTHAPLFVNLDRFDTVRRLSKEQNGENPSYPLITRVTATDASGIASALEAVQSRKPTNPFTAESIKTRLATLINPWTSEGFFADVVVLVEGPDDRAAVLGQAMLMGLNIEADGCAVVPCMGKTNIDRLHLVFTGLGIPTYIVFDGDKDSHEGAASNCAIQRLLGVKSPVDFPPTSVGERCAVFEQDLNQAIRNIAGDEVYLGVHKEFQDEYGYGKLRDCEKSPLFIKRVLQKASEEGRESRELKQIVESIVALKPPMPTPTEAADLHTVDAPPSTVADASE